MTDKILKFSASWCGPCKALSMTLKNEDLGVPVEEIDIDENQELSAKFGIRSVPTMVYCRDDSEVARMSGTQPITKIREWVSSAR